MNCPRCNNDDDHVIRTEKMGDYITIRTRECKICGNRFKTREIIKYDTNRDTRNVQDE